MVTVLAWTAEGPRFESWFGRLSAVVIRDGKETEPSKNEPNQNRGFAKNRTVQEPKPNRTQPVKNRTEPNPNLMVLTWFFH